MDRAGGPESRRGQVLGAAELSAALAGNARARRELMLKLMPIVQARVARILVRARPASGVAPRQELQDVMQEVFVALFEDDARTLRAWDESRGLSLANFVGLVAERQTVSILRSGKRSPFRETPSELEELDRALDPEQGPEPSALSRDLLVRLVERLRETLSPKGLDLFYRLYVDDESVDQVAIDTGLSTDALYAWRSRLGKQVRALAFELAPESSKMSAASPPLRSP
jgi:DNA-directed RNA polymerase specialized sigma24 family protein